jgi:tetratricopeptide (TPR) repeat protein
MEKMRGLILLMMPVLALAQGGLPAAWQKARDVQDRAALDGIAQAAAKEAEGKAGDAAALYRAALAESLRSEVAMEQRDKGAAGAAAQAGIRLAERAVAAKPGVGEYHRLLGTLCGQVIPANVMLGLKYGRCALEEVNKAIELEPKSAVAWMSRGVGNYYLPASFGGGADKAIGDFDKAAALDPKSADIQVWRGIALRKLNRAGEARAAFERSLKLNPARKWAKEQLEKTPAP